MGEGRARADQRDQEAQGEPLSSPSFELDWEARVARLFPDWNANLQWRGAGPWTDDPVRAAAWDALAQRLRPGDAVEGTVIARAPFGAWLDLGVGFAAMIELPRIADLTPVAYQSGAWCPLGSTLRAFVLRMGAGHLRLTQLDP